jgi:hypothetical protein
MLLEASQEAAPRDDDPTPHGQRARCDGERMEGIRAHEVCMCVS